MVCYWLYNQLRISNTLSVAQTMNTRTENIMRLKDFPDIEKVLIAAMYEEVKHTPKDGKWRVFHGTLKVKDKEFILEAEYLLKDMFIELGKRTIKKKDGVIIVNH